MGETPEGEGTKRPWCGARRFPARGWITNERGSLGTRSEIWRDGAPAPKVHQRPRWCETRGQGPSEMLVPSVAMTPARTSSELDLLHGHDLWHVVAQHVLDPMLQRGARGRA